MAIVDLGKFFAQTPEMQKLNKEFPVRYDTHLLVDPENPNSSDCRITASPTFIPPDTKESMRQGMWDVETPLIERLEKEAPEIEVRYEDPAYEAPSFVAIGQLGAFLTVFSEREKRGKQNNPS